MIEKNIGVIYEKRKKIEKIMELIYHIDSVDLWILEPNIEKLIGNCQFEQDDVGLQLYISNKLQLLLKKKKKKKKKLSM